MSVLVLDANILMRAVLGKRVRLLLAQYGERIELVAPDIAFVDARSHGSALPAGMRTTGQVLASALALGCPIWTEDTDFFVCGVAIWTTDRVEMYLSQQ